MKMDEQKMKVYEIELYCCDDCESHTIWIQTDKNIFLMPSTGFFNLKEIEVPLGAAGIDLIVT